MFDFKARKIPELPYLHLHLFVCYNVEMTAANVDALGLPLVVETHEMDSIPHISLRSDRADSSQSVSLDQAPGIPVPSHPSTTQVKQPRFVWQSGEKTGKSLNETTVE